MSGKRYLIYSPGMEDQLERVIKHPLVAEKGIQLRKVKLADLASLHVQPDLNHALSWVEQQDYPRLLWFAKQKKSRWASCR
nr:hypothetical protein [Methylomarinum sp. Ch1-1]MDP4519511.1 hypothetical protein [Methylomarinum sp. Ch1-1]